MGRVLCREWLAGTSKASAAKRFSPLKVYSKHLFIIKRGVRRRVRSNDGMYFYGE